jgi:acyl carrier protein
MNIDQEIKKIVSEIIGRDAEQIDAAASFTDELGVDSLMMIEILAAIENKYKIEIDPEKLAAMKTLQGVINVAQQYLNGDRKNAQE